MENPQELDEETSDEWEKYFSSLKIHEKGHADIGIEASAEIEEAIAKMEPNESCRLLSFEANKIARQIINLYHKRNLGYANYSLRS